MNSDLKEPAQSSLILYGVSKWEDAPTSVQMEAAYAGSNFRWHWRTARDETGNLKPYDPWDAAKPHLKQQQFHEASTKYRGFIGGRGSGKSRASVAEAVKLLIEFPGLVAIVVAPTYKQLESSTKQAFFEVLHPLSIHHYAKDVEKVTLTNGSVVWFRSTEDPDPIRGLNSGFFLLDEGAKSPPSAWPILIGTLRQPGMPNRGVVSTTPRGFNWVYERFGSAKKKPAYTLITASSHDNPHNPPDFVHSLEEDYVGTFAKQEIEGLFVGYEGLVYAEARREVHQIDTLPALEKTYYLMDWGYRDAAVCLVAQLDNQGRVYIVDEFYETHVLDDDVVEARVRFQEKYGRGIGIGDPADPGAIQKMKRAGLSTIEARKGPDSIQMGIRLVHKRLQVQEDGRPRLFIHKRCVSTWDELQKYSYPEDREGKPVKELPVDMNNHAMDCVRYLCLEIDRPRNEWKVAESKELDDVLGNSPKPNQFRELHFPRSMF